MNLVQHRCEQLKPANVIVVELAKKF